MHEHPTTAALQSLIDRVLAGEEREALRAHLVDCDDCFSVYETLWEEAATDLPSLSALALHSRRAARIEARLFRCIRLASLGSAGAWLVSEGFLRAALGLLLPLVELRRAPVKRGVKP